MKQYPKTIKFKKNHKSKKSYLSIQAQKVFFLNSGFFGLKALEAGKLNYKQIEACRKSLRRDMRKKGKIYLRVFTYHSITKKSVGMRMGTGKGNHSMWICPVRQGQVICEIFGVSEIIAVFALRNAGNKLPFKVKIERLKY
jgi:large subunit ribosomal protein L16